MNYYFTYGTADCFPYEKGCTLIKAKNKEDACNYFAQIHPHPFDEDTLNCAFVYNEQEFEEAKSRCSDEFSIIHEKLEVFEFNEKQQTVLRCLYDPVNNFNFIARDHDGTLAAYENEPHKSSCGRWLESFKLHQNNKRIVITDFFPHDFLSWEDDKAVNISSILANKAVEL